MGGSDLVPAFRGRITGPARTLFQFPTEAPLHVQALAPNEANDITSLGYLLSTLPICPQVCMPFCDWGGVGAEH